MTPRPPQYATLHGPPRLDTTIETAWCDTCGDTTLRTPTGTCHWCGTPLTIYDQLRLGG